MKYYVRLIKPYIQTEPGSGVSCRRYEVKGYDWVSEDLEEELRNTIKFNSTFDSLVFEERFVEVI